MVDYITTISGKRVDILDPDVDDLLIDDIAHSLSHQNRFLGHINREWFSPAQHSVNVSLLCQTGLGKKAGLLHELDESITGDLPTPFKYLEQMSPGRSIGKHIQKLGFMKFLGVSEIPAEVKEMDIVCLYLEAKHLHPYCYRDLKSNYTPSGGTFGFDYDLDKELVQYESVVNMREYSPNQAKILFLDRYHELFGNEINFDGLTSSNFLIEDCRFVR